LSSAVDDVPEKRSKGKSGSPNAVALSGETWRALVSDGGMADANAPRSSLLDSGLGALSSSSSKRPTLSMLPDTTWPRSMLKRRGSGGDSGNSGWSNNTSEMRFCDRKSTDVMRCRCFTSLLEGVVDAWAPLS
jgi:hypothetical protein